MRSWLKPSHDIFCTTKLCRCNEMQDEKLVEAALFVAGKPVSDVALKKIVGSLARARRAVENLIFEYQQRDTALEIVELDKKYVMQLKPEYSKHVKTVSPKEISSPALRTLAMIAYHQPVTQSKLVQIRGNAIYDHLSELKQKNLITPKRHGRTFILTTGEAFADYFNLKINNQQEIREKIIELAKEQNVGLDRWLRKKPSIITTPMYESLLTYCGIKQFQVSDKLYVSPECIAELGDATVVVISRGYAERIREHFTGEIIEVSASTFKDLIESMKKLKNFAKEKTINKKITEITEMKEQYIDKTISLTTAVSPSTNMAVEIAKELRLPISAKGKKLAPDYSITTDEIDTTTGALIQIPTHQKNIDVVGRINERYRSIIDQIKQIEESSG